MSKMTIALIALVTLVAANTASAADTTSIGDTRTVRVAPGDLNEDGMLDQTDLDMLQKCLFGGGEASCPRTNLDVNRDGSVDISDVVALGRKIAKGGLIRADVTFERVVVGDTNGDGKVGIADLYHLGDYLFGSTEELRNHEEAADINGDGRVNVADFYALSRELS